MKQEKIRKARKLVWLLLLIIPLITAGVTYFMVTSKNTEIDNAILSAENQRVQTEEDMQQLTEDRKKAEEEHKEKQKEVSEQENNLQDMRDERKSKMEKLEKEIAEIRTDEDITESLKTNMAEMSVAIEKTKQIEDEETKKETLLPLQEQLDEDIAHLNEYNELMDMVETISKENEKLESLKIEEQEQQDELKQMQTDLDNMETSIAQLKENAENLDVSRPVMQTYMIYAVSISVGGSLLIILLIQLILGSILKKAINSPTLPPVNAEEPKSENEITQ